MSKHRRPSALVRASRLANSPLQLGIAAGVAGTVAVTGTVVASATPKPTPAPPTGQTGAAQPGTRSSDLVDALADRHLRDAVAAARLERLHRLADANARAIAKRHAAKREEARRAAERRTAHRRAAEARAFNSASRGVERMSASSANLLQIAAAAASGAVYSYGSTGPNAFDCSGYTSYVFAKVGIALPRTSSAQRAATRQVNDPHPGDLVFVYNGAGGSIGHVGIYGGGGFWWEASNPSSGVGKHRAWSSSVSYGRIL